MTINLLVHENPTRGRKIGCGCCVGPEDDRCVCHIHQDIRIGRPARKCSLHLKAEAAQ